MPPSQKLKPLTKIHRADPPGNPLTGFALADVVLRALADALFV